MGRFIGEMWDQLRSPAYLHERSGHGIVVQRELTFRAVGTYLRETVFRQRSSDDLFTKPDDGDWLSHIKNGMILLDEADRAERASNGLFLDIRIYNNNSSRRSAFGTKLHIASENPQNGHHSKDHDRRIEELAEGILVNTPELRKIPEVLTWMPSLMLALRWHDKDQLMSIEQNHERRRLGKKVLNEKLAHGLGASVRLLAMHKRYAKEAEINVSRAWRQVAGAVAMILFHEEPELYRKAISARGQSWEERKGRKVLYSGIQLEQLYDARELDLFGISPKQILELTRMKKFRDPGFREGSKYGIDPDFEEEYAAELQDLWENEDPLIRDIIENPELYSDIRQGFEIAAEIFERPDQMEMYTPIEEAIVRKLETQKSHERVFWRPDDPQNLLHLIINGSGNLPSSEDSDVRRLLWELVHMNSMGSDTVIGKSKHVQRINKESAIMGVLIFQQIAHRMMRGDMSDIGQIMFRRINELKHKALKRAGFSAIQRRYYLWATQKQFADESIEDVYELLIKTESDVSEAFRNRAYALLDEMGDVLRSLHKEVLYDVTSDQADEQIAIFDTVIQSVLEHLCREYSVSEKQLQKMRSRILRRKLPSLPYGTYDSLGGVPRTLTPTRVVPE